MTAAAHGDGQALCASDPDSMQHVRSAAAAGSDLLHAVRLRGAVFYYVSNWGEWAAEAPPAAEIAAAVLPGAEHVMEFHMVARGSGWAATSEVAPVRLKSGDIVMFPHGDAHLVSSTPGVQPERIKADWVFATRQEPKPIPVAYHRGVREPGAPAPVADADTVLVCGFLGCDLRPFNPLVAALPRLLHLPAARAGDWVARVIDQAAFESTQRSPGADAVLERLAEMMLVDTAWRYLDGLPEDATAAVGMDRNRSRATRSPGGADS